METFTTDQVRKGLENVATSDADLEAIIEKMREAPAVADVLGYSDDELKGTARDEPAEHERIGDPGRRW